MNEKEKAEAQPGTGGIQRRTPEERNKQIHQASQELAYAKIAEAGYRACHYTDTETLKGFVARTKEAAYNFECSSK